MKKISAILLAMLLVVAVSFACAEGIVFTPAGGSEAAPAAVDNTNLVGTWSLKQMEGQGKVITPDVLGMDAVFVLNADGTGTAELTDEGEVENCTLTWTVDGDQVSLDVEGDIQVFTFADGEMRGDLGSDITMVLYKTADGEAAAAATNPFEGDWEALQARVGTIYVSMEEDLGSVMLLTVSGDKATVSVGDIGAEPMSSTVSVEYTEKVVVEANGVEPTMIVHLNNLDMPFTVEGDTIVYHDLENGVDFIFTRVK